MQINTTRLNIKIYDSNILSKSEGTLKLEMKE